MGEPMIAIQEKSEETCNYMMHNQERCGIKLYDNEYCIFHSNDIERKRDEFKDAFWQEFDRQNSRDEVNDFTGFVFPDELSFENITFDKKVYFNNARFFGKAKFGGDQFSGNASFVEAQFHDDALFWNTQFTGRAKFISGKFDKSVDFRQAHFAENAEFAHAHFSGPTNFWSVQFCKKADFEQANFSDKAVFGQTKFHKEVSFWGSQFSEKTDFKQAHFSGDVVFAEAQFLKETSFWETQFHNKADFVRVRFSAEVSFVSTQFSGKTVFNQANFNDLANFKNFYIKDFENLFMEESYFYDIIGLLEFIEENKKKFKYSRRPHKNEFLPDHFTLILGEKAAAKYPLIDRKKRDDMFLSSFRKRHPFWHFLWWLSTDCGRSFRVLGAWCFVIPVLFAAVYRLFLSSAFHTTTGLEFTWISSLYFSFITFTTLGFGDITPIKSLAQIIVTIEVILGYGMLGLLISIMANKLARRS
jgi:hypothetical protein